MTSASKRQQTRRSSSWSQDFQAAVTDAVINNEGAHNTMADYFFSDGPGVDNVIVVLVDAFYESATDVREVSR